MVEVGGAAKEVEAGKVVSSRLKRGALFDTLEITAEFSSPDVAGDAQGRVQGSATTDRYGKTTYRDSMGRVTGTKTTK